MARSNEPLFWGPFSAGMMVGALFVPAMIVITGILLPLGVVKPEALQHVVNHWLTRLLLFVVISLSFFHFAHRFRYILFDVGVNCCKTAVAVACYGSAIVGTLVAGLIALKVV